MFVANKFYNNILDAPGVDNTGILDCSSGINTALSSGGMWWFPDGTYKIKSPIILSVARTSIRASGNAVFNPTGFVGSQFFTITADYCTIEDIKIQFTNTTTATNSAANGIQITGAQGCRIENVYARYINGWVVQSTGGSSTPNYNTHLINIQGYQCLQGFHLKGVSGSGFGGLHFMDRCYSNQMRGGHGFLIEDFLDLVATNIFSEPESGSSGNPIQIVGNCNAIYFTNFDVGLYPGPQVDSSIYILADGNGSPSHIGFSNGITQGGNSSGVRIDAGTHILFENTNIYNNATFGVRIVGGSSLKFKGCTFDANGSQTGGNRVDFQSASTSDVTLEGCTFATNNGVGAQQTNKAINDSGFAVQLSNCSFIGTGYVGNAGNIFNGYPKYIRNNPGLNPIGDLGAPAFGASPYTPPTQSFDYTAYIAGGTVTSVAIGGKVTGLTSGAFRVASGQTITVTYTVAPSWTWLGD